MNFEKSARTGTVSRGCARAPAMALIIAFVFAMLCWAASGVHAQVSPAHAQVSRADAAPPPIAIAVLVSSRTDTCFDPGEVEAIRKLAMQEEVQLNKSGGIAGRQLKLRVFDDRRQDAQALANMREILAEPSTLAIVGLSNSSRGKLIFDTLGKEIKERAIPFISDLSTTSLIEGYPNVFTTRASQEDERIPTLIQFIVHSGVKRPGFVGLGDAIFSKTLREGLERSLGDGAMAVDRSLKLKDNKLDPAEIDALVGEVRVKAPDLLFLSIGGARANEIMRRLAAEKATPPLFITGRIANLDPEIAGKWPSNIYELAWENLPEVYNDRLRRRISRGTPEEWNFEGRKIDAAPGWRTGECKAKPDTEKPDPLRPANMRAIGIGTQFADMLALIAETGRSAPPNADVTRLRTHLLGQLGTKYAVGRGAFKGSFENWSFAPQTRTAARSPFIVVQPKGLGRTQLAPVQFARLKDNMRRIETLYLDMDMIRLHRVDDNEKTFFADFYVSMRTGVGATLDHLEFTNAFLDPKTNERQLTVRTLHAGGPSDVYPEGMRIYQVSGKFIFDPLLATYPFDSQRFSIDIQPKKGDAAFIIQPPPADLRDKQMGTDGWEMKDQYVGTDEDFVPIVDARSLEPSIVPFYKASFVWEMRRQTTDYFLRVVVPLGFILLVAYLSIFIPMSHFEAIITLQVTALLSAVALYLSLPKLDADTATLSDRIFLFDYMLVSLMVGISILRVSGFVARRGWLKHTLGFIHMVLLPVLVAGLAVYIYRLSLMEG